MKFIAKYRDELLPIEVERHGGGGYRINLRGRWFTADLVEANQYLQSLLLEDGRQFLIVHHSEGPRHEITFAHQTVQLEIHDPLAMKRRRIEDELGSSNGTVKAIMPGRVVRILVSEGETVRKGAGLLILEAMKMENEIPAPRDGVVKALLVQPGQAVDSGNDLLVIE